MAATRLRLRVSSVFIPTGSATLVSGHGGREKIVELAGIDASPPERRPASSVRKEKP
jgi:hypothetical protein